MSTISERSWNSSDDYEDDNSTTHSSVTRRISLDLDLPGGVITTHCVSTVIRPGSKQTHDPLQFVKIRSTELSKKAVEQIRLAEEVKITKEKIKEVEEEWQNNLLNWKSKRRQSRGTGTKESESEEESQQRKVKTFSEILNEKAKSGHRIGYNLHKYIGIKDEDEEEGGLVSSNNHQKDMDTGSSRLTVEKNGLEEEYQEEYCQDVDTNNLKDYASSYENQQMELQKKRQELNSKLQELEQLENKQKELERHEREAAETAAALTTTMVNKTSDEQDCAFNQAGKDTLNDNLSKSECSREKITEKNQANCPRKEENSSGESQSSENRQKSVWNYLLTQQEQPPPRKIQDLQHYHQAPNNKQSNDSVSDGDDDDELNDSLNADETEEKEQMLSFLAKLSTFESLSKSDPSTHQSKTKFSKISANGKKSNEQPARMASTVAGQFQPASLQNFKDLDNSVIKNRPPTAEDLTYKEEIKVYQQRLQYHNEKKHQQQQSQPPLHHQQQQQSQYYQLSPPPITHQQQQQQSQPPLHHQQQQQPQYYNLPLITHQPQQQQSQPPLHLQQQQQPQHYQLPPIRQQQQLQLSPPPPITHQQQQQQPQQYQLPPPLITHQQQQQPQQRQLPPPPITHQQQQQQQQPQQYQLPPPLITHQQQQQQQQQTQQRQLPPPPAPITQQQAIQQQKQMLSVSGKKKCSNCGDELGRGYAAMVIEILSLYYHINCFRCSVCHIQLGNGTCGTDVRVRNHKLHCHNCYSNDEAGLKFSRV